MMDQIDLKVPGSSSLPRNAGHWHIPEQPVPLLGTLPWQSRSSCRMRVKMRSTLETLMRSVAPGAGRARQLPRGPPGGCANQVRFGVRRSAQM